MKPSTLCLIAAAFALVVSCEKPQSEAEKYAQIEREVQERLAAGRQADDRQRLALQQAEVEAREKALAYTWEDYRRRLVRLAREVMDTRVES